MATTTTISPARWLVAVLVGLGVWAAASSVALPFASNTVLTAVLPILPGIVVAGLVARARSTRQWLTIALLVAGSALAVSLVLVLVLGNL